jgi:hypothetical protein
MKQLLLSTLFFMPFCLTAELQATTYKVQTVAELKARVEAKLQPNDTILLANGT